MFLRVAFLVFRKDYAVEVRSLELLCTTLFFSISCLLVFWFALFSEGQALDAAAGILWIAIAFSGTLALGRTFERERYGETLRALLLAPVSRPAIYLGKLIGIVLLMGIVETVLVPLVALLFAAPLFAHPLLVTGLLAAGTIGFASVGTLFAAMLARVHTRDIMLPILLYPITIPVIIAGVRGTTALLSSPVDEPAAAMWLAILASFDVVFVTLSLWTFEPLMTE